MPSPRLILASGSLTRQALLTQAGLEFSAIPAEVDEDAVKARLSGTPRSLALTLAALKAQAVSRLHPDALVIGADQVLLYEEIAFSKPADLAEATAHLRQLSGKTHELATAISLHQGGQELWAHQATPRLTMRPLSVDFIARYLSLEGEAVCASVGAYRLEGPGIQLFDQIEGDFFTILGLPLLALLSFLRSAEAIPQ